MVIDNISFYAISIMLITHILDSVAVIVISKYSLSQNAKNVIFIVNNNVLRLLYLQINDYNPVDFNFNNPLYSLHIQNHLCQYLTVNTCM
jgi:hypothetical protein